MADSILGLLFEINADPSKAEAALKNFESSTGRTMDSLSKAGKAGGATFDQALTPALGRTHTEIQKAHGAAMVFERELGIHMPRGITSMLAHSNLIGPALTAAFSVAAVGLFIENIPKIVHGIQDAADTIGGFGKEAKKAFEEVIKGSDEALIKFKNIAAGTTLVAETLRRQSTLETEKAAAEQEGILQHYLSRLSEFSPIMLMAHAKATGRSIAEINADIAKQQTQLAAQLTQLGTLEETESKRREAAAKREAGTVMQQAEKMVAAIQRYSAEYKNLQIQLDAGNAPAMKRYLETETKLAEIERSGLDVFMARKLNMLILEKQRTEELAKATEKLNAEIAKQIPQMPAWITGLTGAAGAERTLTEEERARLPLMISETNSMAMMILRSREYAAEIIENQLPARRRIELQMQRQLDLGWREVLQAREDLAQKRITRAEEEAIEQQYTDLTVGLSAQRQAALHQEVIAQINTVTMQGAALLQVLGFRKAAAIVEALWETAQAYAAFARYDFWSGTQHSLAAATYAVVAAQSGAQARGIAGPGAGGGGTVGTGTAAGAPSTQAVGGQQAGGTRVQINFYGHVYGGEAGVEELVRKISTAVEQRDLGMKSYASVRKTTRRA